nr:transposase family protein [Corallococcus coralloides]
MEGTGARCPACQVPSHSVRGSYVRRPADLSSARHSVHLALRIRRFCCRNLECTRRTFTERPLRLLFSRARRTRRLATAQCTVGMTAGAECGARLLKPLAMPTSPNTLLRLMSRTPLPPRKDSRVLGIDNWALPLQLQFESPPSGSVVTLHGHGLVVASPATPGQDVRDRSHSPSQE